MSHGELSSKRLPHVDWKALNEQIENHENIVF